MLIDCDDAGTAGTQGTEETVRLLYAQHGRALLAYAERFTGDRGRAEDVVQETFLRAWRQLPGLLDDQRPVRAWLVRVTHRLLVDAARAARTRPPVGAAGHVREPTVEDGVDRLLDQAVLADALRRLSPAHRQIVIETYVRGTPIARTAARLGVPAGTARSRLHYALAQLRGQLTTPITATP